MICKSSLFLTFIGIFLENISNSLAIVGGIPAQVGQFSYQAVIQNKNDSSFLCGGTVLSNWQILTTASCVVNYNTGETIDPKNLVIKAGKVVEFSELSSYNVANITVNPSFDRATHVADLAIIQITTTFKNDTIQPIPWATKSPKSTDQCVVSGWGVTQMDIKMNPSNLTYSITNFTDWHKCQAQYKKVAFVVQREMLCAENEIIFSEFCSGDIGDPFVCNNVLSGIATWYYRCSNPYLPGLYTDLSFYNEWLATLIKPTNSSGYKTVSQLLTTFILILFSICY